MSKRNFCLFLLCASVFFTSAEASVRQPVKPFNDCDPIAFCLTLSLHPFEYIKADNNWEILNALQTPHSINQLDSMGIKCNKSQLMFLKVGGLVSQKNDLWQRSIPIFGRQETEKIRQFSRSIAEEVFKVNEAGYHNYIKILGKEGFKDNAFSLLFSCLLDGIAWEDYVTSYEEIGDYATWKGVTWVLDSPRKTLEVGTNGFGHLKTTWSYEQAHWANSSMMVAFNKEYKEKGIITDENLKRQLMEYDLVDNGGNLKIPTIDSQADNEINRQGKIILDNNKNEVEKFLPEFMSLTKISRKDIATIILYHELMWDTLELLQEKNIAQMPKILYSKDCPKKDMKNIVFWVSR